jgi:excisionase family DNA binding protein
LSSVSRSSVGSAFWQEQARRFGDLRQERNQRSERHLRAERHLGANYHPDGWNLDNFRAFHGRAADRWYLDHSTPQAVEEFKSIAGVCAVAVGAPNTDTAWVEWLDCLRRESVDFKPSELVSTTRSREWRPEPDFEIVAVGLIVEPLEVRAVADAQLISFALGEIDDVAGASERVCRRLADEALKIELESSPPGQPKPPQGAPVEGSPSGWTISQPWEAEFVPEPPAGRLSQVVVHGRRVAELTTTKPHDASRTMTLKEAALSLRVSEDTLQRMRKRGELRMFKVGARWRILASEVVRLREQPKFANR